MNHAATGRQDSAGWQALPRERLAPVGASGADAMTWISRGATGALALALAWWLWAALQPLPSPDAADSTAIPSIPSMARAQPDVRERQSVIVALGAENLFAADRQTWARLPRESSPQTAAATEAEAKAQAEAAAAEAARSAPAGAGGSAIAFTPRDQLPDNVKKALTAIELKAVWRDAEGHGVAMIALVHSAKRPMSQPYRVGDEFTEETNAQAPWRVEAVDLEHRRVLLSRSGTVAALPLYRGLGDGPVVAAAKPPEGAAPGTAMAVERRTRDEVVLDLRRRGVSEADIRAVIESLDAELRASGEAPIQTLGSIVAPVDAAPTDAPKARRPPPPGMEAVLKMMESQSRQVKEKAAAPSAEAPTPPPAPPADDDGAS